MSLADPMVLTINSVSTNLPRTSSGDNKSEYRVSDGSYVATTSHQYGKRTRRSVKLTNSRIGEDPLIAAQNIVQSMSVYVVIDTPAAGFTVAEQKIVVDALTAYLTASSGARVTQLLGGEN